MTQALHKNNNSAYVIFLDKMLSVYSNQRKQLNKPSLEIQPNMIQ